MYYEKCDIIEITFQARAARVYPCWSSEEMLKMWSNWIFIATLPFNHLNSIAPA